MITQNKITLELYPLKIPKSMPSVEELTEQVRQYQHPGNGIVNLLFLWARVLINRREYITYGRYPKPGNKDVSGAS